MSKNKLVLFLFLSALNQASASGEKLQRIKDFATGKEIPLEYLDQCIEALARVKAPEDLVLSRSQKEDFQAILKGLITEAHKKSIIVAGRRVQEDAERRRLIASRDGGTPKGKKGKKGKK